ncbi:hypothetical protein FLONG3_135 [Fusarium longipes]|uniref:Uncharacterized protein n=1 Tax=Fusarium longipes TaxID=694270 RepID=A0A395TAJ1_9HYPO|nr:hypothetical protein FLONG3_135 [Fusarium longipes]
MTSTAHQFPAVTIATYILESEDFDRLKTQGLVLRNPSIEGTLRIHWRRLNRLSEWDYSDIPLESLSPYRPEHFATIPSKPISPQALEYVGFKQTEAHVIYTKWDTNSSDAISSPSFFHFAKINTLESNRETPSNDVGWRACMQSWGIATEMQDAIMDERFRDIRVTKTCLEWVADTIDLRQISLREIKATSCSRCRGRPATNWLARNLTIPFNGDDFPQDATTTQIALYKAVPLSRLEGIPLANTSEVISRLGEIRNGRLQFSFYRDITAARHAAIYMKRRDGVSKADILIVQLILQREPLKNYSGQDVTKYVFYANDGGQNLGLVTNVTKAWKRRPPASVTDGTVGHQEPATIFSKDTEEVTTGRNDLIIWGEPHEINS